MAGFVKFVDRDSRRLRALFFRKPQLVRLWWYQIFENRIEPIWIVFKIVHSSGLNKLLELPSVFHFRRRLCFFLRAVNFRLGSHPISALTSCLIGETLAYYATHRRKAANAHRLADALGNEPRGLESAA